MTDHEKALKTATERYNKLAGQLHRATEAEREALASDILDARERMTSLQIIVGIEKGGKQ
jgi:hypothetical protein